MATTAPASTTGLPAGTDPRVEDAVEQQQAAVAVIQLAALAAIIEAWGTIDFTKPVDSWFTGIGLRIFVLLSMAQEAAAATARQYVVAAFGAQGIVAVVPDVDPMAFAGRASDGRDLETLLLQTVVTTQRAITAGEEPAVAAARGEELLTRIVQVQTADAAREANQALLAASEPLDINLDDWDVEELDDLAKEVRRQVENERNAQRVLDDVERILNDELRKQVVNEAWRALRDADAPKPTKKQRTTVGWVRVLTPPSCGRCAVLAGRFYRWNEGFLRHDHCDCIHIPVTLASADSVTTDARAYFDSLSAEDQDHLFGAANAEAIRAGADISQVVNATARKNGMYYADGRQYTREGTTKRGRYRRDTAAGRRGAYRPTPLQIITDAAGDRAEAVRLLRSFGYITD